MRWAGSKDKLSKRLAYFIPYGVKHYVEPFLGWGRMYVHLRQLEKYYPFDSYHLNDINADVMNLWQALQGDQTHGDFLKRHAEMYARYVPGSLHEPEIEAFFEASKSKWILENDPYSFYFLCCHALGQRVKRDRPNLASIDRKFIAEGLTPDTPERFAQLRAWLIDRTTLTCRDALDLLREIPQDPTYFCYIDPSYPAETTEELYEFELTDAQHRELADILHSAKFRWLLSIGIYPLSEELYGRYNPVPMIYSSSGRGLKQVNGRAKRPKRSEWAVMNYGVTHKQCQGKRNFR